MSLCYQQTGRRYYSVKTSQLKLILQDNLSRFVVNPAADSTSLTRAAVALTIETQSPQAPACLYLTLRSGKLRKHAGQFALPGGKLDAGETPTQAALRELSEELGVSLTESSVLGTLDDFITRSGFVITPVVLWKDSTDEPVPNPDEVARFYRIPLDDLEADDLADHEYTADNPVFSISPRSVGTSVYSPTAAIIYQFREVALLGRDTRVAHYEQPAFAWR